MKEVNWRNLFSSEWGLLFLLISLFFTGCPPKITLWDPDAYHTGKVLENKDWETEVSSHYWGRGLRYPNIGAGYGLPANFNIRGRFGKIGVDERDSAVINSVGLNLTKGLSKRSPLFTSGSLGLEILSTSKSGRGFRFSGCYALGFYPVSHMGIYLPLKVSCVSVKSHSALAFVYGLGMGYERSHFFIRMASNIPIQLSGYDGLELSFYEGLQIGIRW